jgi:hypothetical protein
MKKITLSFSLLLGVALSYGQYSFTKTTGTYSNLVSPISLTNGATWDDPQLTIPLGFNFDYFDSTINKIFIEDFGLGAYLLINTSETGVIPTLIPYGADIVDRGYDDNVGPTTSGGLSPISYQISGTSGSKIMKIEWKNVGFLEDIGDNGISIDFTNFQLWLYEGSNVIEIHFGPNSITQTSLCFDNETGSSVQLLPEMDYTALDYGPNGIILKGSPSSPSVKIINHFDSLEFLNGVIPNGTIYRFSKTGGTISLIENSFSFDAQIFPNPANNFITITSKELNQISQVLLIDINGKLFKTINNQFNNINISDLNSGVYFVKIISKEGLISNSKFVKI